MKNIMIGGAMRSGTTLLNNILCHIPDTNPHLPECQLLQSLGAFFANESQRFDDFNKAFFADRNAFDAYCSGMVRQIFANVRRNYACKNVVLKHPESTPLFYELNYLLGGDALFFVMVRNPLDTITSMVKVGEKLSKQGISGHFLAQRDVAKHIPVFLGYYERLYATFNAKNVLWVKYEDLVLNPAQSIKGIEAFAQCDLSSYKAEQKWDKVEKNEAEYLLPGGKGASAFIDSFRSDLYGKPISKEGIDQYKTVLTPEEIQLIQAGCGKFMQAFGYV